MTEIKSSEKVIRTDKGNVYDFLSDINNFSTLVPEGKARDFEADRDHCSFLVDGLGQVGVRVVSREPGKYVMFESEGSIPFQVNLLIELEQFREEDTLMKMTLNADLNFMMKMIALNPLKEGLERAASELTDYLNERQWT
jgi:hypothetical protein